MEVVSQHQQRNPFITEDITGDLSMSSSKCAAATEHSLGAERKVGVHCHIHDSAMEEGEHLFRSKRKTLSRKTHV